MHSDLESLEQFLLKAKSQSFAGNGPITAPSRPGSTDRIITEGDYLYRDSIFDGEKAIGQEMIWYKNTPIWGENYYGQILRPDLISFKQVDALLQESMERMYTEQRFLGPYRLTRDGFTYLDCNEGDMTHFQGLQEINRNGLVVFSMFYHGGTIDD